MRVQHAALAASLALPIAACRSSAPNEPPRNENVVQPLGLEELTIVSKGLE
jgi:hypothetical protein